MLDSNQSSPYNELAIVMADYHRNRNQGQVSTPRHYLDLKNEVDAVHNRAGEKSWSLLWEMVDLYLDNSVKTAHPLYLNQLWAGQSEPALVGSVIEALTNTSMYTFEVAPIATVVENEMRQVFADHFGLQGWGSQVTTGGSNSNYLALLLALHSKFPNFRNTGLTSGWKPRVYVSADAHYSFDKAVMMAGLGLDALVKVPVDSSGAMDIKALEQILTTDAREKFVPCLIVGTAGTTVRGAFDPFKSIAQLARSRGCWFHIDAAWGGAIHYASKAERWLDGSTEADSFSWDAHKMLGVPLMCSLLFVKNEDLMTQAFQLGDTSYIFHDKDQAAEDNYDLGPSSLQCGRRVDTLKMWFEYLYYGKEGFNQRIDRFLDLSAWAEQRILNEPGLELQAERWINNICFRSRPMGIHDPTQLNAFNHAVRERLKTRGLAMVNQAYIGEDLTIRLVIANREATTADITGFFDLWVSESRQLEHEWRE